MFRFTLKNIWAYKTRLGLSMVSIILGVAFLSGTLVFSATIKTAFDDLFASIYKKTDAVVRSTHTERSEDGFSELRSNIDRKYVKEVEAIDGVKSAEGGVQIDNVSVLDKKGKRLFSLNGPPSLGFAQSKNPDLALFYLVDKNGDSMSLKETIARQLADDEMYIDKASAEIKKIKVGDTFKVILPNSVKEYKVAGFVRFGTADGLGGPAGFLFNQKQAQLIAGKGDTFSDVSVAGEDGLSQEDLKRKIEKHFEKTGEIATTRDQPLSKVEVVTGKTLTDEAQDDARGFLNIFTYILLGFAFVSFFVALVIIVNSFAIVVAQRKREYALLRAIGAKASQIRRSVFSEAILVGFIASGIGVAAGIGLATGIIALMDALDIRLPAGGLIVQPGVIIFGLAVGTLATLGSALIPAWIASRVPPIEALRESAFEKNRRWRYRIAFISVFAALAAFAIWRAFDGPAGPRVKVGGIGIFFIFVVALSSLALLVRPFTAIVGSRAAGVLLFLFGGRRAFGVTGEIARRNNYRNPRRTGRTALALMIGVSLVVFITVLATSVTANFDKYFKENFAGDLIIGDFGATRSLTPERCDAIDKVATFDASSCFTNGSVRMALNPKSDTLYEMEPLRSATVVHTQGISKIFITPFQGKISNIGSDGIVISKKFGESNNKGIGDKIGLQGAKGPHVYTVTGILKEPIFGDAGLVIDYDGFEKIDEPKPAFISIATLNKGVSVDEGKAQVEKILKDTGIEITDQKSLRDSQISQLNAIVNIIYGLLALAIIIAAIGIVNTMSLSILERRRELGLMRAIGTTKAQVRGFVRFESVIIAVLGTVAGMILGIASSFILIKSLKHEGFDTFSVDPGRLITIIIISAILGVVAGAWPAWRATKVDVLKAVTVE